MSRVSLDELSSQRDFSEKFLGIYSELFLWPV
jgi:hypothetical protein